MFNDYSCSEAEYIEDLNIYKAELETEKATLSKECAGVALTPAQKEKKKENKKRISKINSLLIEVESRKKIVIEELKNMVNTDDYVSPDLVPQLYNCCMGIAYEKAIYYRDDGEIIFTESDPNTDEEINRIGMTQIDEDFLNFNTLSTAEQSMILRELCSRTETPRSMVDNMRYYATKHGLTL